MKNTPSYIKALLIPSTKPQQERKVWSIPLESVVIPFLTATNTMGDTAIPVDALGAPLRLARDKDNAVRFGNNGKPIVRVVKPISAAVTTMRENFIANLKNYAETVQAEKTDDYALQMELAREAAEPIHEAEKSDLDKAYALRLAESINTPDTCEIPPVEKKELQPA